MNLVAEHKQRPEVAPSLAMDSMRNVSMASFPEDKLTPEAKPSLAVGYMQTASMASVLEDEKHQLADF